MAYSSFALFPTLPAIYNLMPSQKHKRRTATSIMAGYFDPRPVFTNDLTKTTLQPVRPSSLSSVNISDPAPELPRHETRPTLKKSAPHASRKSRKFNAISVIQGTVSRSKGKRVKDVHPDDKENAVSNREPPRSSSPRLTSSPPASPLPSVTIPKEKPKASGFWRARSSNTSASPAPSSLKRKLSTTSQGSALPSQIGPSNTKKSRLSTSLDPEAPSRLFASSDSLSFRSSSLDFDTQNLVSEDKPKIRIKQQVILYHPPFANLILITCFRRSVNDDTKLADEGIVSMILQLDYLNFIANVATTQPSEGVPIKEPVCLVIDFGYVSPLIFLPRGLTLILHSLKAEQLLLLKLLNRKRNMPNSI